MRHLRERAPGPKPWPGPSPAVLLGRLPGGGAPAAGAWTRRGLARPGAPGPGESDADRRAGMGASMRRTAMTEVAIAALRLHPLAERVPEMRPAEWRAFLADVRGLGILKPLRSAPDGMTVLDRRHRLRAAQERGLATLTRPGPRPVPPLQLARRIGLGPLRRGRDLPAGHRHAREMRAGDRARRGSRRGRAATASRSRNTKEGERMTVDTNCIHR